MGFMVVDPPAGEQTVRFEFPMPLENRVGWGLTALSVVLWVSSRFARSASCGAGENLSQLAEGRCGAAFPGR